MAVPVAADGGVLRASKPTKLFAGSYIRTSWSWDVSADGQRFRVLKQTETSAVDDELRVVINWFDELKRLVPTK